jgi:DNA polymerase III alpha subunit
MTKGSTTITWHSIIKIALEKAQGLGDAYIDRLQFELKEIDKQGANIRWVNYVADAKKFSSNPNYLVLPWLLDMVEEDPIAARKEPMLNTVRASKIKEFKAEYGFIPSDIIKDSDMPDIDLDCLPEARDPIKEYAAEKYGMNIDDGYGPVCSVGTWQTYKLKQAIIDASSGTGLVERYEAYELTTSLPDEVDQLKDGGKAACKGRIIDQQTGEDRECGFRHAKAVCPDCGSTDTDGPTIGQLLKEHDQLAAFAARHKEVLSYAVKLVGRVRNMGMHAGALIIADRTLYGNIPLAKSSSKGYWVSMWTEGRNTQLSKFGYNKWDILGLKTLKYIFECCKLIEQNRHISFGKNMEGMDYNDPANGIAGWYIDGRGKRCDIELNDQHALRLANEQKTDGVFQFDTDLAKSILANGVRNFEDLMLFNAMGHPGPMASIPEAVANREDTAGKWKKRLHPQILEVLKDTYGVIVYQEQLQTIWQKMAGFTAPEAQEARKAVAKKWTHKLKPIRDKWLAGATRTMELREAEDWWSRMETFGRYAFNRSHAVSYCLVAHHCLWFKAHFAPEWWAAVMSDCHPDKLVRYMGIARSERWRPTEITYSGSFKPEERAVGVKFDILNLENMTRRFTVTGDVVNQGLIGIKGIGDTAADKYEGIGKYSDIDDFIDKKGGKDKSACERFIKLGAFGQMPGHDNRKALWTWYQYKYCSGKDITQLRKEIRTKLLEADIDKDRPNGWDEKAIEAERERMITEYKKQFPNRRKIPDKFYNWQPKPNDSRERVMSLVEDDFTLEEILGFEDQYLGYYLHSPLDLYCCEGTCTIEDAKKWGKEDPTKLEVVIADIDFSTTRTGKDYARIIVSDGMQQALVLMWHNEMGHQNADNLKPGTGVQMFVQYDETRNSFTLARNEIILRLKSRR